MLSKLQRNVYKNVCKLIAELANTDKRIVKEMINRLEHSSGLPGLDIRMTGEIYGTLHMKMRELGLDPYDTTPEELYKALQNLTLLHDKFLAKRLAIDEPNNPNVVLPNIAHIVNRLQIPKQIWALKPVAIKRILKALPPKYLMKQLHYRSIDSLLKRESPSVLLTVAKHIESATWQNKLLDAYKKVVANDFEVQKAQVIYLDSPRWKNVGLTSSNTRHSNFMHAPESGVIVILPMPDREFTALTLTSLLLVLHWLSEVRMYSTFFKFHHMQAKFGELLRKTLSEPTADHARIAGQPIHWRIIHRYYGSNMSNEHPEIFQPHIQPEDIAYRKAESILYRLEPALKFWHSLDYVGQPLENNAISFNLMDNALNLLNGLSYQRRVNYHMRDAVWNELYCRYLGEQNLEKELLQQLDQQFIKETSIANDMEFSW